MSGATVRHLLTITNPQGLHMRPIASFVEAAGRFQSNVQVSRPGSPPVSGKSAIAMLTLGAEQGTEILLEISGPDAEETLRALLEVLARPEEDG